MRRCVLLAAAISILLPCGVAFAQVGGLSIRVLDARDSSPLPGANVTLSSNQGFISTTTRQTGPDGVATFPVLRSGTGYVVEVSMPGFGTRRVPDLRVRSNQVERFDVMLAAELEERVEVVARSDVVPLDSTASSAKFDEEFIENLPVPGRFYQNILSLAPGVNDADGDGNPNVHGARMREFRGVVGGVANTDPLTGEWLSYVNPASIEEMEIISAGAGVEFGRASGGFARIVQRQGSNDFEGLFSYLFRSSALDTKSGSDFGSLDAPDYEWHQPALMLSGPIIKDKLWYRLSHEYIQREEPVDFLGRIAVMERSQTIIADQLTWQVSPRNKLALQYQYDPIEITNYGVSAEVTEQSTQTLERGGPTYSLTWTAPVSPTLLVDTVVAYQNHQRKLTPTTAIPEDWWNTEDWFDSWNGCVFFWDYRPLNTARCRNSSSNRVTGPHHETSDDRRQRLTFRSQATLFAGRLWGVSQRFKLGIEIENERYFRELDRGPDIHWYTVYNPFGLDTGVANTRLSAPRTSSGEANGTNWALYVEDQFRPLDNLTVTLGLRIDREEIDSEGRAEFDPAAEAAEFYSRLADGYAVHQIVPRVFTKYENIADFQQALATVLDVSAWEVPIGSSAEDSKFWDLARRQDDIQIRNTNFSPRLSVAWDPWGDGKTKFAVTAGRYYDKIFLGVPLLEIEPEQTSLTFLAYQYSFWSAFWAGRPYDNINATVSSQVVDRDLQTPYQDELTLSFERMLWPETSIRLSYVKRDYHDQLQDVDVNHRTGDEGRCAGYPRLGNPTVIASNGEGHPILDPYTGEIYTDTDPGPGDGIIDDCMGNIVRIGGPYFGYDQEQPDGKPDLYVLNPGWGDLLLVGNFNATEYEAFVLELVRRQYRNWQMNASYTWSQATGQAEDFTQIEGNERTLFEDEKGLLAFDQTHAVKVSAVTITPWNFRIGGTLRWESGLPYSLLASRLTAFNQPLGYLGLGTRDIRSRLRYPTGQRNDQRNPSYWTVDLRFAKEFPIGQAVQFQITAEVFNLLDDRTLNVESVTNGQAAGARRFGRSFQLGLRLAF